MSELREMIKRHEGLRLEPYKCSAGKLTIGFGRNLTDVGITKREADYLLDGDIYISTVNIHSIFYPHAESWPHSTFDALTDMMFNLGLIKFRRFKKMIAALEAKNWNLAADEMLDSKWSTQVGQRAIELAEMVRKGGN